MYLTPADVAATLAAISGLAPGSEVVADYILAPSLRDAPGAMYAELVSSATAERGEPWLSSFEPGELTALAASAGIGQVRHVGQRDAIPAGLWQRTDALSAAALAMLLHGRVTGC
jgi:O-methyltransferase involved in polyketide biosynthesis